MTGSKDILTKAIAYLKQQRSAGPPPEVVKETLAQLAEAESRLPARTEGRHPPGELWPVAKLACAAGILIILGYGLGRVGRPQPIDVERLRAALLPSLAASIEPAIREKLAQEMGQSYRLALANTYVQLKEELTQQQRDDMNRFAAQTLAASNAVTNRFLAELLDSIKTQQTNDLRSVATALRRIESNRLKDKEALAYELATLAYQTEDQLQQTRAQLVRLLLEKDAPDPQGPRKQVPIDPNERSSQ